MVVRKKEGISGSETERELAEARAQQAATSEILKVIARSPSDAQPVFDAIAQAAVRLIGGFSATVTRADNGMVHLLAMTSTSDFGNDAVRKSFPRPIGDGPIRKAIDSGAPVCRPDIETDPNINPLVLEMARSRGYRSLIAVPMMKDGAAIGVVLVTRREPGTFTSSETDLLKTFADQAVIAIENVRLFNETKASLERQTATAEILKVIASSPSDVQPVLEVMAMSAARLCEAKDVIVLLREGDALRYRVHRGDIGTGVPLGETKKISRDWSAGRCAADGRQIHVHDILADPEGFPEGVRMGKQAGYRTVLMTPLLRDGVVLGVIGMRRAEVRPFETRQIELINTFADQAVIAIENVRLFNETRALHEERLSRLKSFFSPQLAELLDAGKGEELLKTHRREITVQFFDLRGFTAFTGAAEPEEVMELLKEFHGALGRLVMEQQGTIERFAGDSVMVFFNDPLPVERPAERAVQSALAMMHAFEPIAALWKKRGYDLGLGAGIAQGYATLGAIGFEGRRDYAAIGPVTNLAARLCAEAKGGQILADSKTVAALEGMFDFDALEPLRLKGFSQPMPAFALRIGEKMRS
jgi:class 3 adenylate cyclase